MTVAPVLDEVRGLIAMADFAGAERLLRQAVQQVPDFYLYHARLGDVLTLQNDEQAASAAYAKALEINPSAGQIKTLPAASAAPPRTLHLFMPFYTPRDESRYEELMYCLDRNLACSEFADITLLVDDDTPLPRPDPRLRIIRMDRRPSYLDWVREARARCRDQIAILANSDICFTSDIALLRVIFATEPHSFIALSRFEKQAETLTPHPNPHWSQDTWAFCPGATDDMTGELPSDTLFDVPLGVPRCDNKIAYVFSVLGYSVRNPFPFVTTIHVHETGLRYYDRTGDRRIVGGMAMVHPSTSLTAPSQLDVEVWSINTAQFKTLKVNKSLEKWADEKRRSRRPPILSYDADWQYPAITEQRAFQMMRRHLVDDGTDHDVVYLAFPYATLIDLRKQLGPTHPRTASLQAEWTRLADRLGQYKRVITVCQHIHMRRDIELFAAAGVTDIFWTHCIIGQDHFPEAPGIRLHPFPLYPVQQTPDSGAERSILYSFVGSRANKGYLTECRNQILDILQDDPRGKIINRDTWHYNAIVYDKQIYGRAKADTSLVDDAASVMFRDMLNASIFTLCPSGTGPNSIRLWEAALNGSIPVVMADTYLHPGPEDLWQAAVVICAETPEAIAELPARLSAIAADPPALQQKRTALRLLADRYGPDNFVPDVLELMGDGR